MKSNIIIREAKQEDAIAIAAILHALSWIERLQTETSAATEQHVTHMLEVAARDDCNTILVAERSSEAVVGYLAVHWFPNIMRGLDGYVSELFVHPNETGQGAGSNLLKTAHIYAVERGCTRLLLMNRRIRESYQRGFYAKQGWEELYDGAFFSLDIVGK